MALEPTRDLVCVCVCVRGVCACACVRACAGVCACMCAGVLVWTPMRVRPCVRACELI